MEPLEPTKLDPAVSAALLAMFSGYAATGRFPRGFEYLLLDAIEDIQDALLDYCGDRIIHDAIVRHIASEAHERSKATDGLRLTEADRDWLQMFNNL